MKKSLNIFRTVSFLIIFLFVNNSYATDCDMIITDITGIKHQVNRGYAGNYPAMISFTMNTKPQKWLSIYADHIKEVNFAHKKKKEVYVSVLLKNDENFSGISTDTDKMPHVYDALLKSELRLEIEKISKIEFFHNIGAADYFKQFQQHCCKWRIIDGATSRTVTTLLFIDHYLTNIKRYSNRDVVYKNKFFMEKNEYGQWKPKVPVINGASEIDLEMENITYFEITGNKINGKPEVIVKTKDGKSGTMAMKMVIKQIYGEDGFLSTSKLGSFENYDYYAWDDLAFGVTAISLKPLRKIIFERID